MVWVCSYESHGVIKSMIAVNFLDNLIHYLLHSSRVHLLRVSGTFHMKSISGATRDQLGAFCTDFL